MAFGLAGTPVGHAAETDPGNHGNHGNHPTVTHESHHGGAWTNKDAKAFWTPRRMAAAAPPVRGGAGQPDATSQHAPTAEHFDGIPSVGVLFSVDGDAREHHCTASVVHSPRGNLILTAGHCNAGAHAAFVPQYQSGEDSQPYGVWAIEDTYAYADRATTGGGADLDFAFATVAPDDSGRRIEDVTGANTLTATPGYRNQVNVIGYPSVHSDPADRAVRCATTTQRLAGTRQLRMECNGFYGGTSGSPWLAGYDPRTRTGRVIGVIGGVNGGGPRGPHSDRTSYSPYFGKEILSLYDRAAQAGEAPQAAGGTQGSGDAKSGDTKSGGDPQSSDDPQGGGGTQDSQDNQSGQDSQDNQSGQDNQAGDGTQNGTDGQSG
ncbi:hypothetical protein ABT168_08385 [Streptomyces sp. NPDC001793]|uniref:trypsin-like serine peptidase n=1 Tax=Streptomyces sp. NPDC001793 TaxID=3154657 RepID=UPI003321008C